MIKKLSKKLVFVFSMLAVVIFTVSSCYATPTSATASVQSTPYSIEDIKNSDIYKQYATQHLSWSNYLSGDCYFLIYSNADGTKDNIYIYNVKDGTEYIRSHPTNSSYLTIYNSSGISSNHPYLLIYYDYSTSSFVGTYDSSTFMSATTKSFESYSNFVLRDITTIKVVNAYGINFEPITEHVDVSHEFQSDTSAIVTFDYSSYGTDYVLKYSLAGIEVSTDLTAPITLKNPVIYYPGVTNLQVKENTKIYWVLYDSFGDSIETDVYTVPEYTSSNVDKELEYNINYNEDFTVAYLNVSVVNGEFSDKLYYSEYGLFSNNYEPKMLFPASGTLEINHNCNLHIILYDYFGNIICADYVTIDKIGTIPADNFKVNVSTSDKTVILYPRLYNILQSDFYDIEYDVSVDSWTSDKNIILYQDGVYIGNVFDINSSRACLSNSELRFYQNIGTSNITITFRIINIKTGATCITRTISFKIGLDSESTGVTGSTTDGSDDNSFIIGTGSFSENFSGFLSLNENSSIKDIISTAKGSLENISIIFSILPGWLWLFVSVGLGVCILLRILSR